MPAQGSTSLSGAGLWTATPASRTTSRETPKRRHLIDVPFLPPINPAIHTTTPTPPIHSSPHNGTSILPSAAHALAAAHPSRAPFHALLTPGQSSPRASSPTGASSGAASGAAISRPLSPASVPGGARTAIRRRAAADQKEKLANVRPSSTRAAGAGGSSSTMLRLYTDESPGLKVDPVVVLVLSLVFIFSVVALHSMFFYSCWALGLGGGLDDGWIGASL